MARQPATPAQVAAAAEETKADKFRRLGGARMMNALKSFKSLQALANKAQYEWTPEQATKMLSALEAEYNKLGTLLTAAGTQAKPVKDTFAL